MKAFAKWCLKIGKVILTKIEAQSECSTGYHHCYEIYERDTSKNKDHEHLNL